MQTITPKEWDKFQHYKDRSPSWIKLHRNILDDYDFHSMHDASKALAPLLWLLASEYERGEIPFDIDRIAFRMRMSSEKLASSVKPLIDKGFFVLSQGASELLAECLPREEKRESKRRERGEEEPMSGKPDDAVEILDYLNAKAKRSYKPVKSNVEKIVARLSEGASVLEAKRVIDRKCQEWLGTDMEQYLRPDTLFNATKFNQYVGQLGAPITRRESNDFRSEGDRRMAEFLADGPRDYPDDGMTLEMEQ